MVGYEELSREARALGMNWAFNTIEGLEFAVEFFRPKPMFEPPKDDPREHVFNYGDICVKCGIDKRALMLMSGGGVTIFGADLRHECDAIIVMKKRYNIDINKAMANSIELERERRLYYERKN